MKVDERKCGKMRVNECISRQMNVDVVEWTQIRVAEGK